jgi:hypothetical protein
MIAVAPHDLVEGQPIAEGGKTRCWETEAVLREGDEAIVHFQRASEAWSRCGVYHPAAVPTITYGPDAGDPVDILAEGRLAVCSDAATQEATLRIVDVEARLIGGEHDD